jgi:hypothetical protein
VTEMTTQERATAFLAHMGFDPNGPVIEHYGKLGMKWGVRNDKPTTPRAAARAQLKGEKTQAKVEKRQARTAARDEKFDKSAHILDQMVIMKRAAARVNENLKIFNDPQKYALSKMLVDSPEAREYYDDFSKLMTKYLNDEAETFGRNASGTKQLRFNYNLLDTGGMEWHIEEVGAPIKHADDVEYDINDEIDVEITYAANGFITHVDFVEADSPVEPGVIKHYGVMGMKWGRRKAESVSRANRGKKNDYTSKQRKRVNALKRKKIRQMSNEELTTLNKRLQLEKQYKDLKQQDKLEAIEKGQRYVRGTIAVAQTANQVYAIARSPLVQDGIKLFRALKSK